MTLVYSLPQEYSHFTSPLLLLSSFDKNTLRLVFIAEDINRQPRTDVTIPSGDSAFSTSALRLCGCPPTTPCEFCDKPSHCEHMCYTRQRAKDSHKVNRHKRKGKNANKVQETSSTLLHPPIPSQHTLFVR